MKTLGRTQDGSAVKVGSKARVIDVDGFGFQGREFHPLRADIGFEGIVVCILEESEPNDGEWACYRVCGADGRVLDLMSFEFTVDQ